MDLFIRAPNHLGDGVMALPALQALGRGHALHIQGPAWAETLYRGLPSAPLPPRGSTAVLFKPSFSAAWQARRFARRVGLRTDARGWLLTDGIRPGAGHRQADLDALAAVLGAEPAGRPQFGLLPSDHAAAPTLPAGATLLLPGTASGAPVAWPHYRALADALHDQGRAVVFAGGPAEAGQLANIAGPHPVLPSLPLGPFGAVVSQARHVVGNDSGLSHFSAAVLQGLDRAPTALVTVFGSTDPAQTGPPGAHVQSPGVDTLPCWPCYRKTCEVGLLCMPMGLHTVLSKLSG